MTVTPSSTSAPVLPLLLEEVEVTSVELVSPSFVRIELASAALEHFGVDGPSYDLRIKLVFPEEGRPLPSFEGYDEAALWAWFAIPAEERGGHIRTYSLREVRGSGAETRLVVDFVLHVDADGHSGPGAGWAAQARVGDRIIVMVPRAGVPYGGIEFQPGRATRLLLVGDETAVPAISAILEQLPPDASGDVFLEVPVAADRLEVLHPAGVSVTWLPRDGAPHGEGLHAAVVRHLGGGSPVVAVDDEEVDPDLWETPAYSSSGEEVADAVTVVGHDHDGLYIWIAGESRLVTGLRRVLVNELEVDRSQVAFMGYWRFGVAMKS